MKLHCSTCKASVDLQPHEHLCPRCDSKLRESVDEMNNTIALQQTAHTIKRARLSLLIAGILSLAGSLFFYLAISGQWEWVPDQAKMILYANFGVAVALLGIWGWSAAQPLPATIVALALYGGSTVIGIAMSGGASLSGGLGWVIRGLILASLISGVLAALEHNRLRKVRAALA